MTRAQRMFAEALIVVGVLGAVWVAVERVMVEQTNRIVAVAVDWDEVRAIAAAEGLATEDVLADLKAAGATHLAVSELALSDLVARGEIALFSRGDIVEVWAGSPTMLHQVGRALQARFPGTYRRTETAEGEQWLAVPAVAVDMAAVGAGYPSAALEAAHLVGMPVVARPRYQGVRTPTAVEQVMAQAADTGAQIIVFAGEQVVGFPGMVETTALVMQQLGLTFGLIELAPQLGEAELATRLGHRIVRVHSITEQEMRITSAERAVERYVRAARERGVRLLYLRMLPAAPGDLSAENVGYVQALRRALATQGMGAGAPEPVTAFSTPPWVLAIVRVGACGGLLWLVQALFGLPGRWFWALAALLVLSGAVTMTLMPCVSRVLAALMAAIIFPVLAVGYSARAAVSDCAGRPTLGAALGRIVGGFLMVCAVTALGGLLVVGLLGDSAYLVQVSQFRGVKLAQVLPVLGVALLWLARAGDAYRHRLTSCGPDMIDYHSGDAVPEWPALWAGLREALGGLVRYWHVLVAFVGLGVLALLVIRSGNEAAGTVLPMERELRAVLDRLLVVRPRSKEVFLGHPVLLLALLLAARKVRPGLWIAFAVGAIGQVSLLNSFCHTHTPLLLTLLRVVNGLWLGLIGGVVLCALWDGLGGRPAPEPEQQALPLDEDDGAA